MKSDRTRVYQELGERLQRLRKMNGWSQGDVAERLEWSYTSYSDIEGCRKKCDLNGLLELAAVYDVTTNFLITGDRTGLSEGVLAKMESSLEWMRW